MLVASFINERTPREQAWHSPLVDVLSIRDRSIPADAMPVADVEFEAFLEEMMFQQMKYGIALPQSPSYPSTDSAVRVSSLSGTALENSTHVDAKSQYK